MKEGGEVKTVYPFASRLVPSNPITVQDFERRSLVASKAVYLAAYHYTSNWDLVEEFCDAGVRPLRDGYGFRNDELQ